MMFLREQLSLAFVEAFVILVTLEVFLLVS